MLGQVLGSFRIEEELGSGGMGTVYRATTLEEYSSVPAGGAVALKVIHPNLIGRDDVLRRFQREGEAGTRVHHENVVVTHGVECVPSGEQRICFLVMEYVKGASLREALGELGSVPESLLREIARQTCRGLAAIHAAGIVHRDLKPDNVLITEDHHVRIMDLGVSRIVDESLRLTRDSQFTGSLLYAAPEQFGRSDVGPAADLYAMGVLLYELATGQNPFQRPELGGIVHAHLHVVPTPARDCSPAVSEFLDAVIARLLSKESGDRFPDAEALLEVLERGEESAWWKEIEQQERARKLHLPTVPVRRETVVHGRDAELAQLRDAWLGSKTGEGRILLISGEAGIGKTRLVGEFLSGLEDEDAHILYGSYPPSGRRGALSDSILDHFGSADLTGGVARYLRSTPALLPAFAAMVRHERPPDGSFPIEGDALHALLCSLMRGMAEEKPVVWILDDLHFAPPESRKLVVSLARAVEGRPVLLILTSRTGTEEELEHLARLAAFTRLPLGRLGARDVIQLLGDALRSESLVDRLGAKIAYKSDGVPFFVFELIRGLRDGQLIRQQPDGSFVETRVIEKIEVPSAVRDLIEARLRGVSDEDRDLLDVAAVIGYEFDPILVAMVCELRPIRALQRLAAIERKLGLVLSESDRYRFDHHQIQEVLYEKLSTALRREYHAALADGTARREVDSLRGESAGERAGFLANHYLRGGRAEDAVAHIPAALDHLTASYRNDAALNLLGRALEGGQVVRDEVRTELLLRQSEIQGLLGMKDRERETLDALQEVADRVDEPALRGRARARLGRHLLLTSDPQKSAKCFQEALGFARQCGDTALEIDCLGNLGNAQYMQGHYEAAHKLYEQKQCIAEAAGDRRGAAAAEGSLGILASVQGRYDEAEERYGRVLDEMRELGDRRGEVTVLGNLATLRTRAEQYEEAGRLYEQVLSVSRAIGYRRGEAIALGNLGIVLSHTGEIGEAWQSHLRHLAISAEIGDTEGCANAHHNVSTTYLELGDLAQAKAHCEESLRLSQSIGARRMEAYGAQGLGEVFRAEGNVDRAIEWFEEALRIWQEIDYPAGLALARFSLGRLHSEIGNVRLATENLDEAIQRGRDLDATPIICQSVAIRAGLPGGDAADALREFETRGRDLGVSPRAGVAFHLWRATGDPAHLTAAAELLEILSERAPEEYRESLVGNVALHRLVREELERNPPPGDG